MPRKSRKRSRKASKSKSRRKRSSRRAGKRASKSRKGGRVLSRKVEQGGDLIRVHTKVGHSASPPRGFVEASNSLHGDGTRQYTFVRKGIL